MNKSMRVFVSLSLLITVSIFINSVSYGNDLPELRVARISHIEGQVTMERMSDDGWIEATINTPLMAGDKIYAGLDARAEIQLDDEVVVRLDRDTFLHFEFLDDDLTQLRVVQGTMAIHAHPVSYYRPQIVLSSVFFSARITDHAKARLQIEEQGPAELRVRKGSLLIEQGDDRIRQVWQGDRIYIFEPRSFMKAALPPEDEFDLWCDLRDARDSASRSPRYVSTRVSGYSDLDRYGNWVVVQEYGRVWRPTVIHVDWAPYRDGYWIHRRRTGWVWVSYEPWGWVPYHYGRWVHTHPHGWCWVPVDVVVVERRPRWYPALVAFTYSSSPRSFGVTYTTTSYYSGSYIGWFPLGPADPFYSWHFTYVDVRVRHDHRRSYQNERVPGSVTVIPREDLGLERYQRMQRGSLRLADSSDVKVGRDALAAIETSSPREASGKMDRLRPVEPPKVAARTAATRSPALRDTIDERPATAPDRVRSAPAGLVDTKAPTLVDSGRPGSTRSVESSRARTGEDEVVSRPERSVSTTRSLPERREDPQVTVITGSSERAERPQRDMEPSRPISSDRSAPVMRESLTTTEPRRVSPVSTSDKTDPVARPVAPDRTIRVTPPESRVRTQDIGRSDSSRFTPPSAPVVSRPSSVTGSPERSPSYSPPPIQERSRPVAPRSHQTIEPSRSISSPPPVIHQPVAPPKAPEPSGRSSGVGTIQAPQFRQSVEPSRSVNPSPPAVQQPSAPSRAPESSGRAPAVGGFQARPSTAPQTSDTTRTPGGRR